MDQGQDEQPVRAGPDADPLVRDGGVAGPHRVDRHHLGAARLELGETALDRVAVVILGHAEHQEVAGMLPVRLAELPEAAADRVLAGGGHVDRATAMRSDGDQRLSVELLMGQLVEQALLIMTSQERLRRLLAVSR